MKGKLCLTYLIAVHNEMTGLVNERRAVDVVQLDFCKAFYIPIILFNDKQMKYGLS